jgi:predicted acylesterase/phospholipase RssA
MIWKNPHILVICGGGFKGSCYLGALTYLSEIGVNIKKIPVLAGSSIGAIICLSICLGYSLEEMKKDFMDIDAKKIFPRLFGRTAQTDQKILPLLENGFSLHDGNEMDKYLMNLFYKKNLDPFKVTFKKLRKQSKKKLVIAGSNITKGEGEYYSSFLSPNMLVYDALRISSRLPWFLPVIKKEETILMDGDLLASFPLEGCKKKDKKIAAKKGFIGFIIEDSYQEKPISNIFYFFSHLIKSMLKKYFSLLTEKYKKNIITFTIPSDLPFILSKKQMEELWELGYQTIKKYQTKINLNSSQHKKSLKDLDLICKEEHHQIMEHLDTAFLKGRQKHVDLKI